ncbi:hypothetical protein D3C78_1279620 [compost metagenome]
MRFHAPGVAGFDTVAIDLARVLVQLITQFRHLVGVERALHVPELAVAKGRFHLTVDEFRHTGFNRARTILVGGNQVIHRGNDEVPFGLGEIGGFVGLGGRCGLVVRGVGTASGQRANRQCRRGHDRQRLKKPTTRLCIICHRHLREYSKLS